MKPIGMINRRRTGLRAGLFLLAALPILTACDGFDAASKATERFAYRANFKQVSLVADNASQGRVLRMHVFAGAAGQVPRASQQVKFHASLEP